MQDRLYPFFAFSSELCKSIYSEAAQELPKGIALKTGWRKEPAQLLGCACIAGILAFTFTYVKWTHLIRSHRKTESNVILQIILQSKNATLIESNQGNKCCISRDMMECKGYEQSSNSYNEPPEVVVKTVFYSICTVQAFSSHLRMQQEYPSNSICCSTSGDVFQMRKCRQLPVKIICSINNWDPWVAPIFSLELLHQPAAASSRGPLCCNTDFLWALPLKISMNSDIF